MSGNCWGRGADGEDECVFFDPVGHRLVVCFREMINLDLVEALVGGHGCGLARNIRSDAWLEAGGRELGRAFVLGRSGTATELEWMIGEDRNRMLLRTEAVFSASDWEIDVRSEFELHPAADGEPWEFGNAIRR